MSGGVTRRQYRERQRTARDRSHNPMADAQPQALGVLNRLKQAEVDPAHLPAAHTCGCAGERPRGGEGGALWTGSTPATYPFFSKTS
jgi:hypothetical protein